MASFMLHAAVVLVMALWPSSKQAMPENPVANTIVVTLMPAPAVEQQLPAPHIQSQSIDPPEKPKAPSKHHLRTDARTKPVATALAQQKATIPIAATSASATAPVNVSESPPEVETSANVSPPSAPPSTTAPVGTDYLSAVMIQLESHKTYPSEARRKNAEGVVRIAFRIDRNGHISSFAIVDSSGVHALDKAAARMVAQSDPLPALPMQYSGSQLELTLPVSFILQ